MTSCSTRSKNIFKKTKKQITVNTRSGKQGVTSNKNMQINNDKELSTNDSGIIPIKDTQDRLDMPNINHCGRNSSAHLATIGQQKTINNTTLCVKKDTKLLPITSPSINRFSNFFH